MLAQPRTGMHLFTLDVFSDQSRGMLKLQRIQASCGQAVNRHCSGPKESRCVPYSLCMFDGPRHPSPNWAVSLRFVFFKQAPCYLGCGVCRVMLDQAVFVYNTVRRLFTAVFLVCILLLDPYPGEWVPVRVRTTISIRNRWFLGRFKYGSGG